MPVTPLPEGTVRRGTACGGERFLSEDRQERNAKFKEALRMLFQLDAWE